MQIVLAVTGGGTGVIGNYLGEGGKSDKFLEAIVPYCTESLDSLLGAKPDNYCSALTARQMAIACYERVGELRPSSNQNDRVGIGITCSLMKNVGEREERKNQVFIARQTRYNVEQYSIELDKNYLNTRDAQESVVTNILYEVIENPLHRNLKNELRNYVNRTALTSKYDFAEYPVTILLPKMISYPWNMNNDFIYAGSFYPIHEQHKAIVSYIRNHCPHYNVFGELSVENVDKVSIDPISLRDRQEQIKAEKVFDNLLITRAAKFSDKFRIFRNARFVMGADTFNRLTLNNPSIWDELEATNNKLYVFPRLNSYGHPIVMEFPTDKKHLMQFAEDFEPKNISSRDIRRYKDKE